MRHVTKVAFAAVVIAGLGAVVGTIWIGSQVKEQTVVDPYEEGLRYDAERRARGARLGGRAARAARGAGGRDARVRHRRRGRQAARGRDRGGERRAARHEPWRDHRVRAPRRRRSLRGRGGAPRGGAVAPQVRRAAGRTG